MLIYCLIIGSFLNLGVAVAQPWQLKNLKIIQENGQTSLTVKRLSYDKESFLNLMYLCPGVVPIYPIHQCQGAALSFDWQTYHWQADLNSQFDFNNGQGELQASLFNDQVALNLPLVSDSVTIDLNQMKLNALSEWLPDIVTEAVTGQFDGPAKLNLSDMNLSASGIEFTAIEGAYGEDFFISQLSGAFNFEASLSEIKLILDMEITKGEALIGSVYVNFSEFPVQIQAEIGLNGVDGWVATIQAKQSETLLTDLDLMLSEGGDVQSAALDFQVLNAKLFNRHILAAVLELYGFKQSEMEGQFSVNLAYDGHQITQGAVEFNAFYFENEIRKLLTNDLNGQINWLPNEMKPSQISWDSLLVAGMPVDQSQVSFEFWGDEFSITGQPEWPVFDGSIRIQDWHIGQLFSDSVNMEISAEIMPISLALVTEKMGWPLMKGSLSGKIPAVIKKGPVIELKGGLDLNVFEGKMRVNQLSTERLFGVAPVIAGDVAFETLNLGQLTETFDFGRITGLLSGKVDDLRITNWKADRLKAEIYTVEQKGIKQTISQQAIDHISSLGGIQGALSRTFLRFFDDFKYKQIKLSCVLQNSVCQIGGINNTAKQFTIVEGGGIPKINIVGFVREVDWDTFISRLLNANYEG
ncbi:hypothetical protein [Marinicella rhabdoformis]|uniref:hypothetical protein n=1 Tax=Marinicella rhabdoformis TaxID=2580566 RepID=UPI001C552BFC|nr:hypothetical protein [Marinicella rhabdoformis]